MTPLDQLTHVLGSSPPVGTARVDDATVARLVEAVRDARQQQAEALVAAVDEALRHVPFPLRGVVRKVLGQ